MSLRLDSSHQRPSNSCGNHPRTQEIGAKPCDLSAPSML